MDTSRWERERRRQRGQGVRAACSARRGVSGSRGASGARIVGTTPAGEAGAGSGSGTGTADDSTDWNA